MLFHLGTFWRLNELGWLPRFDRYSSVSGGSIVTASLALAWSKLDFGDDQVAGGFEAEVVGPIREFASHTVDWLAVAAGALPFTSIGDRVADAYRERLYGGASLQDFPDAPRFIINATNVESGVLWRFSKQYMADWRVGQVLNPTVEIATAVAASSAFPPFLSPHTVDLDNFEWEAEEPRRSDHGKDEEVLSDGGFRDFATLTDGGVYDNLGLETVYKRCRCVLVSDAGGHLEPDPEPARDWARHLIRVLFILDRQVRALRKRQLKFAYRSDLRDGAYWGIRSDIRNFELADALACPYEQTLELANLGTRLAAIDDRVQERLINWGYAACDAGMRRHVDTELPAPRGFPYPESGVG